LLVTGPTLKLNASTIAANTSSGSGGGLVLQTTGAGANASLIINCTITGNKAVNNAAVNGGGIYAGFGFTGEGKVRQVTINAATVGGGVFWAAAAGSKFAVQNTIIAGNKALVGPDAAANRLFTARLSGANEVPPTNSPGTGTGNIVISPDGKSATVSGSFKGL